MHDLINRSVVRVYGVRVRGNIDNPTSSRSYRKGCQNSPLSHQTAQELFPLRSSQSLLLSSIELSRIQGVYRVTLKMRKERDQTKVSCVNVCNVCAHYSAPIRDNCVACVKFGSHLSYIWASNADDDVADEAGGSMSSRVSAQLRSYPCDLCWALIDVSLCICYTHNLIVRTVLLCFNLSA